MNIAGVILVGGKSSRMGKNKALLDYNGRPLVEHMRDLLKGSGLNDIYISGTLEGYDTIPDPEAYQGPAHAIRHIAQELPQYDGLLFVPVDMPHLNADILRPLLAQPNGAYYTSYPLPSYIRKRKRADKIAQVELIVNKEGSIKALLKEWDVPSINLPAKFKALMLNANTPEQWQEAFRA